MLLSVALTGVLLSASASVSEKPWQDPQVNSRNREPARCFAVPLASEQAALADALEPETPYRLSLNGTWKFHWCGAPDQVPADFFRTAYDDAEWSTIDVPSCVEMRGWGVPNYTNQKYPFPPKPPKVPEDDNSVSSYRRTFTVPAEWSGREVFLRFDGVGSAAAIWLNGKEVGYTEDSYLPAEFNITPYLNSSNPSNLLCVRVLQRCDGSYLEDQDFFRFSGIHRDVTLWAMPKDGIRDFSVKTIPADDYASWRLEVKVEG